MEVLARQGMYSKAAAVQGAANAMEAAEMRATTAAFEAEVRPLALVMILKGSAWEPQEAAIQWGWLSRRQPQQQLALACCSSQLGLQPCCL